MTSNENDQETIWEPTGNFPHNHYDRNAGSPEETNDNDDSDENIEDFYFKKE